MRKIEKHSEPKAWEEYRNTPGAVYQAIPELRASLMDEQGYICAYCMRRIPHKDKNSDETSRIEHLVGRHNKTREMDYSNMVICCPGAISEDSNFHCDKAKGDKEITFSLFTNEFFDTLKYSSKDGTISSSNPVWNEEINSVLNLNHPLLKANRAQVLSAVIDCFPQTAKLQWIKRQLKKWGTKDTKGKFPEYCGIVEWFLKRHWKQK